MNKPDKDGWIEHTPGECPVAPDAAITAKMDNGDVSGTWPAKNFFWGKTLGNPYITHYRVWEPVKPADGRPKPEPEAPTLRDQFAMAALTGLLSTDRINSFIDSARYAYRSADAMLAARKGGAE